MDQIKVGKFILNLRQKQKLTQREFADKLNVTSQAVSKWENGRGIPDIELLKKISEEFNVDISDILNGQEKKKVKTKKYILLLVPTLVIIICLISCLVDYKKHDFHFLNLSSTHSYFSVKGIAAYSNDKKSIYISDIEYLNSEDENEKYLVIECSLYEKVGNLENKIYQCGDINKPNDTTQTLSEFLKNVEFNVDNYSSSCKDLTSNNLFLTINALDTKNKTTTYKIPIELEEKCND